MELPSRLRQAVDSALEGVSLAEITSAADALSQRYRAEVRDGRLHLSDERSALAYLATRMPATYAATRASLAAVAGALPGFSPVAMLDVGAGPARRSGRLRRSGLPFPMLLMLEASPAMRAWGEQALGFVRPANDRVARCRHQATVSPSAARANWSRWLMFSTNWRRRSATFWSTGYGTQTSGVLVVVEPGTSNGWRRILAVRDQLNAAGAHIVGALPARRSLPAGVSRLVSLCSPRVARSRIHRLAKDAEVPWEDEKFSYLAASRLPAATYGSRVIAPAERASGRVRLKLCQPDGSAVHRLVTRREGDAFREARRSDWGDVFEG